MSADAPPNLSVRPRSPSRAAVRRRRAIGTLVGAAAGLTIFATGLAGTSAGDLQGRIDSSRSAIDSLRGQVASESAGIASTAGGLAAAQSRLDSLQSRTQRAGGGAGPNPARARRRARPSARAREPPPGGHASPVGEPRPELRGDRAEHRQRDPQLARIHRSARADPVPAADRPSGRRDRVAGPGSRGRRSSRQATALVGLEARDRTLTQQVLSQRNSVAALHDCAAAARDRPGGRSLPRQRARCTACAGS